MRRLFPAFAVLSAGLFAVLIALVALPVRAADRQEIDRLWQAMRMPEIIEVMRLEGLDYGRSLDDDMLGGRGGPRWAARVEAIYDVPEMTRISRAAFGAALADEDLTPAITFFESPLGARAIVLELEARRTMLDPEADELARATAADMANDGDARLLQLQRFATANDLIENNVAGALNSNFAFFLGLATNGAMGGETDEGAIVAEVWDTEPQVRKDTEDWVYAFLALAYQPLTDAELEDYIAYSETPEARRLNQAIFASFDDMFVDISRRLGEGLSTLMTGEEL